MVGKAKDTKNVIAQPQVRVWIKTFMQDALKHLRKADYKVDKVLSGYEVRTAEGQLVLKSMIGHRGYLVRYQGDLFNG